MATFLLSLTILLASLAGIGLGLFFGRRPPAGSCGGVGCIPGAACGGCYRKRKEMP